MHCNLDFFEQVDILSILLLPNTIVQGTNPHGATRKTTGNDLIISNACKFLSFFHVLVESNSVQEDKDTGITLINFPKRQQIKTNFTP